MDKVSDAVDEIINVAIDNYDGTCACGNAFESLISFGELVDRLSIVNFKLFTLKNEVMNKLEDKEFRSWASIEDVKLVKERSRLKCCIDEKLIYMIHKIKSGDQLGGFNPEVKKYGK
jgi:hypothetical protein